MDRRNYGAAAQLLREVLIRHPADLQAHYRLGVSASHLDQVDEAGREFEWVVAHGEPGAAEVQIAREWLASRTPATVPAPGVVASTANDGQSERTQNPELASLSGRAVAPDGPKARLQLFLKGVSEGAVKDEYQMLRTDQQGNFHFANVAPGDYMLTNAVAGPVIWRLRVTLGRGQRLVLDLSPGNGSTVRDDFPDRSR